VLAAARFEVRERALADPLQPIRIVRGGLLGFLERLSMLVHVS
jgi:hypothetical protein